MGKIILYHGSPDEKVMPKFGLGEEKHDYGKGFYLTESLNSQKSGRSIGRMHQTDGCMNLNWIQMG